MIGNPAQAAKLIVKLLMTDARSAHWGYRHDLEADLLQVADHGFHDLLVATVRPL